MIVAIVLGVAAGVVGFIPLIIGLQLSKKVTRTSNFGHASILLLAIVASFVLLIVLAMLCVVVARDLAFPFVLAEAIAMSLSATGFGIYRLIRK